MWVLLLSSAFRIFCFLISAEAYVSLRDLAETSSAGSASHDLAASLWTAKEHLKFGCRTDLKKPYLYLKGKIGPPNKEELFLLVTVTGELVLVP